MKIYFPHEKLRSEQKKLVQDIILALDSKKVLLANAPTGIGKTASSLAPCLSYALANKKKVFFLTPKSSQHEIALETVNQMNEKFGLNIKTLDLVGKKKLCIHPMISHMKMGFYEICSNAKKNGQCIYYDNTKGKTAKQKIKSNKLKKDVKQYGKSYFEIKQSCMLKELCPYEVTLEMIKDANFIIGDYFHLFNDEIRKTILGPSKTSLNDCILIIDEAHNLTTRIRDMLATTLKEEDLDNALKEAREIKAKKSELALTEIKEEIRTLAGKIPFNQKESLLETESMSILRKLAKKHVETIEEDAGIFMQKKKKDSSFLLTSAIFLYFLVREKKHTLHVTEIERNSSRLSLYPLDPSEITEKIFDKVHSAVLMSGTLTPLPMYVDILGINNAEMKEYSSPFPKENRLNIFVDKTTTKYTERNEEQFENIARIVEKIIVKVPGNTIVFFPSFELMNSISPKIKISRKTLMQNRQMTQDEKTKLVKDFKQLGSGFGGVLLAVSGGSIAEGVDFPGDNLKCAIVIGIPFARVSLQSKELIKFYDKKFRKGWSYAYNAPAISKAVQAAGRVIRTETDKGVCVFLDKRFSEPNYAKFFPKDFEMKKSLEPEKLVEKLFED